MHLYTSIYLDYKTLPLRIKGYMMYLKKIGNVICLIKKIVNLFTLDLQI